MKNEPSMNLVSGKPVEWAADDLRGFFGYAVHIDNGIWPEHVGFPAFTHEQMLECKRICETMGERYSFEEFPHLDYDASDDCWHEVYGDLCDDVEDNLAPFYVDGMKLYALGRYTDWAWGLISDGFEYQEA